MSAPCDQPKTVELLSNNRALQNGGHSYAQRPAKSRRLDGKDRPEQKDAEQKDAYFMVPMSKEDREFLHFQWKDKVYQFNCLPFGLSPAPWVFTKTTRPVVATLRELGLCLIIYIDNILMIAETESTLKDHIMGVVFMLENLVFVINQPKSKLLPTQEIEFLGFSINSTAMELKLPGKKIKKVKKKQAISCNHKQSQHSCYPDSSGR